MTSHICLALLLSLTCGLEICICPVLCAVQHLSSPFAACPSACICFGSCSSPTTLGRAGGDTDTPRLCCFCSVLFPLSDPAVTAQSQAVSQAGGLGGSSCSAAEGSDGTGHAAPTSRGWMRGSRKGVGNGSLADGLECLVRKSARVPQPHVSTPDEIEGLFTV